MLKWDDEKANPFGTSHHSYSHPQFGELGSIVWCEEKGEAGLFGVWITAEPYMERSSFSCLDMAKLYVEHRVHTAISQLYREVFGNG